MKIENNYYNLRRSQLKILMRSYFQNGELYEIMNRKTTNEMAVKLADKYFHKAGPTIYDEVVGMYKVFLCLAPILQKQKNSFKLDWTKGNALSWLRRLFNGRNKKWYCSVSVLPRQHDPELFKRVFRNLGISDNAFIEYALERYLCFWGATGRKGSLANCIFDPLFFRTDSGLRIENCVINVSSAKKDGYSHIFQQPLEIMCYSVTGYELYNRTHIEVRLSADYLKSIRQRLGIVVEDRTSVEHKLRLINAQINSFIENARYAKDAFEQVREVQQYFSGKTKRLAGVNPEFRHITAAITTQYLERVSNRFTYQRNNFFWDKDHNSIPEKTFMIYFSPYREKI
ncbi:MAG: hypothetical protein AB7F25_02590 [Deferribacterales bacterium]